MEDQPIDLGKDVVEEGFARGYVPHARAGKLREHVVRVLGKGVRFSGHEATECVRAGDVEGDVHAVRFEDSLDFGVRACACDAYVGHRGGEVRLRLQGVVDPRGGDGLVRIALRSFAAFAPRAGVSLVAVGFDLRGGDGLVRIALRSFAAFAPCGRVRRLVEVAGIDLRGGWRSF